MEISSEILGEETFNIATGFGAMLGRVGDGVLRSALYRSVSGLLAELDCGDDWDAEFVRVMDAEERRVFDENAMRYIRSVERF